MLYLFNSAIRPLYRTNVLNTMGLPGGWINEYRYKVTGTSQYVSSEAESYLSSLTRGAECLLSFIDRYGPGGYTYHPLRRGTYVSHWREDERLFIKVALGEYVYPRDLSVWQQNLLAELGPQGLAALTAGNAENTHDGFYVLKGRDLLPGYNAFLYGDQAWAETVVRLAETTEFQRGENGCPVFVRLEVREQPVPQSAVKPKTTNNSSSYALKPDHRYDLVVNYRFPLQRQNKDASATLSVEFGESLRTLAGTTGLPDILYQFES